MKTLKEKISIMQACLDGKDIQVQTSGKWIFTNINTDFNWAHYDYRIKPEPLTIWVNIYDKGFSSYESASLAEIWAADNVIRTAKFIEAIE